MQLSANDYCHELSAVLSPTDKLSDSNAGLQQVMKQVASGADSLVHLLLRASSDGKATGLTRQKKKHHRDVYSFFFPIFSRSTSPSLEDTPVQASSSTTTTTTTTMASSAPMSSTSASPTGLRAKPNDSRDCWCSATARLVCNRARPLPLRIIIAPNSQARLLFLPCARCAIQAGDTTRAWIRYTTLQRLHEPGAFHVCLRPSGTSPSGLALCS